MFCIKQLLIAIHVVLTCLVCINTCDGQCPVLIDGYDDDWKRIKPIWINKNHSITSVRSVASETLLYFKVEFSSSINVQREGGLNILLEHTSDKNPSFSWDFKNHTGKLNEQKISVQNIDLIMAPAWMSNWVEFSIRKDMFSSVTNLSLVMYLGDRPADAKVNVAYHPMPLSESIEEKLLLPSKPRDHIRFMSYNFESNGLNDSLKRTVLSRALSVLRPDIIAFQELYELQAKEVESFAEKVLGEDWYSAKQGSDLIVVSRFPITNAKPLLQFKYGAASLYKIELKSKYGTALDVINIHMPCCNYDSAEIRRNLIAEEINRYLKSRPSENTNTPVLIAGDLNPVGDVFPLAKVVEEFPLNMMRPVHLGSCLCYTWHKPKTSFASTNLDFIGYYNLEVAYAFVFSTTSLPQRLLNELKLEKDHSLMLSDHFPLVFDFKTMDHK